MARDATDNPQSRLRETADEFIRLRGALQQAQTLPVVSASPTTKARLAALNKRATAIQSTIENVGKMIDGARRWFADTFGARMESQVPLANPAIDGTVQTSIAAMNYFMRDAKTELDRIVALHKAFEALPADKKPQALAELGIQTAPAPPSGVLKNKWLWIGGAAVALFMLMRGGNFE